MEIDIALGSSQGFKALSSERRIESNTAKIERLKVRKKAALAKVKAATNAAKAAFKALEKAKKAGRIPASVKAAAKRAQEAIDAQQAKVDQADKRITYLTARNELHRSNLKKKEAKSAKPEKKAKPTKIEKVAKPKINRRPEKRIVARPGSLVAKKPAAPQDKPELPTPAKKNAPAPVTQATQFKHSHPQDVQFATPYLNPTAFAKAKTRSARILYLRSLWDAINKGSFHGKMRMPTIGLLRNVKAERVKTHGMFYPKRHAIELSPNLFNTEEPILISAMGHEMAHQYVWDEKPGQAFAQYMIEGGHGPEWRNTMTMIGLTPSRFVAYDRTVLMTDQQKEEFLGKQERLRKTIEEIDANNVKLNPKTLHVGSPVAYVETLDASKRYIGIVVGMGTTSVSVFGTSRFAPGRIQVIKVPKRILKVATADEILKMRAPHWQEHLEDAIESVAERSRAKQRLRESKRMKRGLESGRFTSEDLHRHLKKWTGL